MQQSAPIAPAACRGAVADFGSSQRSAIPGGRGSCRAVRFRSRAVARQEPRPPSLTIIRDYTLLQEELWERSSPDRTSTGPRTTEKMHDFHFNG
jgi:hypothetical protein